MKKLLSFITAFSLLFTIQYSGADLVFASQNSEEPVISMEIGGYNDENERGFFSAQTIRNGREKTSAKAGEKIVISFLLSGINKIEYYQLSGTYDASLLRAGYYTGSGDDALWVTGDSEQDFNTIVDGSESFTNSKFYDSLSFTRSDISPTIYICAYSLSGATSIPASTAFESGVTVDSAVIASVGFEVLSDISNVYDAFQWDDDTSVSVSLDEEYFIGDMLTVSCCHMYESNTVLPTCNKDGYSIYSCVYCTNEYKCDYTAMTGHYYIVSGNPVNNGFTYICKNCKDNTEKTSQQLRVIWNEKYINKAPRSTVYDDSCYLDIVPDGIINAKDFSIINHG